MMLVIARFVYRNFNKQEINFTPLFYGLILSDAQTVIMIRRRKNVLCDVRDLLIASS